MQGGDGGGRKADAESSSAVARSKPECDPDELRDVAAAADDEVAASAAIVEVGGSEEDGDEEEEEDAAGGADGFVPSPLIPLKEQLEKDKEDESLRRWKEQLLGCVGDLYGQVEPEVIFHSIGVVSEGCAETITALPVGNDSQVLFTLKEGSQYRLKLTFIVKHNIVSGLTYSNTVWKRGLKVDQSIGMLGTFAPQLEPYEHLLEEDTTPSGVLARGTYSAKLKFEDDDKRCHLELNYTFEIQKR